MDLPPVSRPARRRALPGAVPPGYLQWRSSCVVHQRQEGYVAVYVRLFLGDVTSQQLRTLAQVLDRFGDGTVRLTIDQNILIPWVDQRSLRALFVALDGEWPRASGSAHCCGRHFVPPGAETCNLAVTSSREVARAIARRIEPDGTAPADAMAATTIKVSGCPNSCGQHHIADIGWHGAAKTVRGTTYPVYQLHLGGGVDANGARFGRQARQGRRQARP